MARQEAQNHLREMHVALSERARELAEARAEARGHEAAALEARKDLAASRSEAEELRDRLRDTERARDDEAAQHGEILAEHAARAAEMEAQLAHLDRLVSFHEAKRKADDASKTKKN